MLSRRSFLVAAGTCVSAAAVAAAARPITRGPRFHWFAYYDKLHFDPTSRYVLSNEVDFEGRSPRAGDVVRLGMIDLQDGNRWTELGESRAWNWQQGCMLQWLPGSASEVIWNDRVGDEFVSHIVDVQTGKKRTLPAPVYSISPDAKWAIYPDFRRLNDMRPGYGYAGIADPFGGQRLPENAGIWRMDIGSGKRELLLSFADAAAIPNRHSPWEPDVKHWFNHLLYSTDGSRFVFLHRWRISKGRGFGTRMFTADQAGRNLHVLDPHGKTSHFVWRDPEHVLAWAWHPSHGERFYLYRDQSSHVEVVGEHVMTRNGHCTYLTGNRWILNDTYPDRDRMQHLYLFHVETGKTVQLGRFHSPDNYAGEWRCDLHPRANADGTKITFDSTHGGQGRQIYLIDITALKPRY